MFHGINDRTGSFMMKTTDKKSEPLYFIAIVPPEPIYSEAFQLKEHFKTHYNSKAALNSPPHITLHMPFSWKESKEAMLVESLERFAHIQKPFELKLNNFSAFEPRVIFIDVEKNEMLKSLQKQLKRFCKIELNLFNADYKELAFHPHLTLAFRDLKKPEFYKAWEEFKDRNFNASLTVNSLVLLKHDGNQWQMFAELKMKM